MCKLEAQRVTVTLNLIEDTNKFLLTQFIFPSPSTTMTIPSKRRCPPTSAAAAPKKKNTNKPSAAPVRPPPSAAQRSSPIDGDEEDEEEEDQLSQDADEEDLVDKTGSAADSQPQASPRLAEIVRALNGDDALLR